MAGTVLSREFYSRNVQTVARQLIGMLLVTRLQGKRVSGVIVETEAYLSARDPASHGFLGATKKNASMFGPAGIAYVYPIHAKFCFNVVTEMEGSPSAVLIRAIQPVEGIDAMSIRRRTSDILNLASGPSRLCQALGIDRDCDGVKLYARRKIWLETSSMIGTGFSIRTTPRIGVTSAKTKLLRFVAAGSPFASGPKRWR